MLNPGGQGSAGISCRAEAELEEERLLKSNVEEC